MDLLGQPEQNPLELYSPSWTWRICGLTEQQRTRRSLHGWMISERLSSTSCSCHHGDVTAALTEDSGEDVQEETPSVPGGEEELPSLSVMEGVEQERTGLEPRRIN